MLHFCIVDCKNKNKKATQANKKYYLPVNGQTLFSEGHGRTDAKCSRFLHANACYTFTRIARSCNHLQALLRDYCVCLRGSAHSFTIVEKQCHLKNALYLFNLYLNVHTGPLRFSSLSDESGHRYTTPGLRWEYTIRFS